MEINLIFKCVCLGMCLCVLKEQKKAPNHWILLGLELRQVWPVQLVGTQNQIQSSAKIVCALNSFRPLEFFFQTFIATWEGRNSLGSLFQKWNKWITFICNTDSVLLLLFFFSELVKCGCYNENPLKQKTKNSTYFD